jgi:hypothetical protein
MKKNLIIVMVLIFTLLPLSAQKTKDVLYLKNGSIIYGKLMEVSDGKYKIKTEDGSLFIYSAPEVDKFVNEAPSFDGRKKNGFGYSLEAGFLAGVKTSDYTTPFSFNVLVNLTNSTKNIFGLGTGVEYIGTSYMPLFLEYKYLTSYKKTTPFLFARAGKLFSLGSDVPNTDSYYYQYNYNKSYEGGFTLTLGTGISWYKEDNETYLSFAYRNAYTGYKQLNYNSQTATYKTSLNRLEIKLGFRF